MLHNLSLKIIRKLSAALARPKQSIESSVGGSNILTGIGISTGASNSRAVGCKWMAGANSYLNDVKFIGGHGTINRKKVGRLVMILMVNQSHFGIHNTGVSGSQTVAARTFKNIWSANTYATSGTYVSNTSTPGRIYAMSIEHHVRNEVRFKNVSNWKVYALQLEEESKESSECQPFELEDCSNMVFANLYMFRVIRVKTPYPYSVQFVE